MGPEDIAGRRERDAALGALEESLTEFLLQLDDLLAQRGLGHVALLGGPAEILGPGDGDEVAQLM